MSEFKKKLSEISQEQLDRIAGGRMPQDEVIKHFGGNLSDFENAYLARYMELLASGKSLADTILILEKELPEESK